MDWLIAHPWVLFLVALPGWFVIHAALERRNDIREREASQRLEIQRATLAEVRNISDAVQPPDKNA